MAYWQVWLTLGGMLYVGWAFHVGCFLAQFASAALLTSGATKWGMLSDLEEQLRFFLFCALVLMLLTIAWRRRLSSFETGRAAESVTQAERPSAP